MDLPKRKPNRLANYEYSTSGAYFITICAKDKHEIFGSIVGAATCRPQVELSDIGKSIDNAIHTISHIYTFALVDAYVIMPNHMHLILNVDGGRQVAAPTKTTVNTIIGNMKRAVSMQLGFSPWQKSFHDHIIRNEDEFLRIWEYIENNPARWKEDEYHV